MLVRQHVVDLGARCESGARYPDRQAVVIHTLIDGIGELAPSRVGDDREAPGFAERVGEEHGERRRIVTRHGEHGYAPAQRERSRGGDTDPESGEGAGAHPDGDTPDLDRFRCVLATDRAVRRVGERRDQKRADRLGVAERVGTRRFRPHRTVIVGDSDSRAERGIDAEDHTSQGSRRGETAGSVVCKDDGTDGRTALVTRPRFFGGAALVATLGILTLAACAPLGGYAMLERERTAADALPSDVVGSDSELDVTSARYAGEFAETDVWIVRGTTQDTVCLVLSPSSGDGVTGCGGTAGELTARAIGGGSFVAHPDDALVPDDAVALGENVYFVAQ